MNIQEQIQKIADNVGLEYKDIDQAVAIMISHKEVNNAQHESKKVEIKRVKYGFMFAKLPSKEFAGMIEEQQYKVFEDSKWVEVK